MTEVTESEGWARVEGPECVPAGIGADERGMTTAELLGNAALGVLALVAIWGLLQTLGVDIVRMIRGAVL